MVFAKQEYGLRARTPGELDKAHWVEFSATTRMSGVDLENGHSLRKGAASSVADWVRTQGGRVSTELGDIVDGISAAGGTPLVVGQVVDGTASVLGVIHLKDVVKQGMRDRFDEMRKMGIRTVMITGDNPMTAKAIADEAGVDDFLAEATPEDKMALIKKEQAGGKLVAMTGDGTNDAPALAQADVGVAMNTGTSAAKEAGNMVDLDSDPTKLIEIVEIGKQLLDHPWRAHDVLDRQRHRQVFRHHPGDVRGAVPRPGPAEHHAAAQPAVGDPVGGDLQRARHRRADPAGAAGCSLHAEQRVKAVEPQPLRLRARRHHRAVHRHQADRPCHPILAGNVRNETLKLRPPALGRVPCATGAHRHHRLGLPAVHLAGGASPGPA